MAEYSHTSSNEINDKFQGSVLGGMLGSITGMVVCILVMLLCTLGQTRGLSIAFLFFMGMVIGWFYRRFHGRRSKMVAYAAVGICTVLASIFWIWLLLLLPVFAFHTHLTPADWADLWDMTWELQLICIGLGLVGFFAARRGLLVYADWRRGPWYVAYAGGNGYLYNLLPEQLSAKNPTACFAVHSRFAPGTHVIVEGSSVRWRRRLCKDHVFSVHDIAGVVLGPSNGCNVLYDKNCQVLAKFAGSMEHADLMFLWLFQWEIPIVNAPAGWRPMAEDSPDPKPEEPSIPKEQFVLHMKRSTRIGFAGIGCFMLLLGLALFLAVFLLYDVSALTMAERCALVLLELAEMGMGIVSLRIGKVSQVEVEGEQMRVVSRFGRAKVFSVKEVSSVSRSLGWIVLYDREFQTLAKVDSYLEDLDRLKAYLASYGVKM